MRELRAGAVERVGKLTECVQGALSGDSVKVRVMCNGSMFISHRVNPAHTIRGIREQAKRVERSRSTSTAPSIADPSRRWRNPNFMKEIEDLSAEEISIEKMKLESTIETLTAQVKEMERILEQKAAEESEEGEDE